MADYFDISALTELDPTTPSGAEPASVLDDALRQVKVFLRAYLSVSHNNDGTLKAQAVSSTSVTPGSMRGSTGNAGTAQELAQGTVSTPDLRDLAVTEAKLGDAAVTGNKLGTDAVTTAKIQGEAVTTAKLAIQAVTREKLADSAVGTDQIEDGAVTPAELATGAVTNTKLGAGAVTADKVSMAGSQCFLINDAGVIREAQFGGVVQVSSIDHSGTPAIVRLAFADVEEGALVGKYVKLSEVLSPGTSAGASVATTWTARNVGWVEQNDALDLVGVSGATITIKEPGSYYVRLSVPFYAVGKAKVRLRKTNGTADTVLLSTAVAVPASTQAICQLSGAITVAANDTFEVQYYCDSAVGGNGLGIAVGGSENEVYSTLELFKA